MFSLLREKFAQRFFYLIRLGRLLDFVPSSCEDSVAVVSAPPVGLGRLARRVLFDRVVVFEQVVDVFLLVGVGRQLGEVIRSSVSGCRFL